ACLCGWPTGADTYWGAEPGLVRLGVAAGRADGAEREAGSGAVSRQAQKAALGKGLRQYPAHLPTSQQTAFLLDGSGRFAWRTSGFSSGVYLLRFVKNGEVLHQEKAVVVK
ncbi:MAG: hypothetical protein J5I98_23410, partial [Phaeodactylibacter sp.]|nr:hypothetical protein [Phaeodactylibacter sp.]